MKNLAKDLPSLGSTCKKKFLKIPLGDHGDLGKLLIVKSKQLCHCPCHFPRLCHRLSFIRIIKFRFCLAKGKTGSSFFGCHIFRASEYPVLFPLVRKNKFHKSLCLGGCVLASEHGRIPYLSACLPVKRKGDRIKDRGFA